MKPAAQQARKCLYVFHHTMESIGIEHITHRDKPRILLKYANHASDAYVRQIKGRRWSSTRKAWHIPPDYTIEQLNKQFAGEITFYANLKMN